MELLASLDGPRLKGARPETPRVARHADGWLAQAVMDY